MTSAALSNPARSTPAASGLDALAARYAAWREANPRGYLRNGAAELGVSELELLLASDGEELRLLRTDDLPALLAEIAAWGELRTMSRNDHAVIEQTGHYENLQFFGKAMGQTVGQIDLRIFARHWAHAVAAMARGPNGPRGSVQFFDAHGVSIHKVFTEDMQAFEALCQRWGQAADALASPVIAPEPEAPTRPDSEVDVAALRADWDALKDTHDFISLLKRHDLGRTQALRLAGPERARPVQPAALKQALELVAEASETVMIFVGNRGIVQIFIGSIGRVVETRGWLNVLDPGFDLHVRDGSVADAWVVTKPTRHGPVRSLECYSASGETVLQLFGKRTETDSTPPGMASIFEQVLARCSL